MTYNEAYDKIIQAYFRDEIQPYLSSFCFCGTLCDGDIGWRNSEYRGIFKNDVHKNFMSYTGKQYADMERALLIHLVKCKPNGIEYEEKLFEGMSAALDVLKQIHIERGEIIDEDLKLTQRNKSQPCNTY